MKRLPGASWHEQLEALRQSMSGAEVSARVRGSEESSQESPKLINGRVPRRIRAGTVARTRAEGRERIQQIAEARGVQTLYHFTDASNLRRILAKGLLPRTSLHQELIEEASVADTARRDPFQGGVCLSVGFPAYKMFYRLRAENRTRTWVVLAISSDVLWSCDCAFFPRNAASAEFSGVDRHELTTPEAFARMFGEVVSGRRRPELGIDGSMATDPQAEVIVFGGVHQRYITAAFCEDKTAALRVRDKLPAAKRDLVAVASNLFGPRLDYPHWPSAPRT